MKIEYRDELLFTTIGIASYFLYYDVKAQLSPYSPVILYYRGNLLPDSAGVGVVDAGRCINKHR